MKPESRIQRQIRRELTALGGKFYKIWAGPYQQAGIPDLIGCVEGLFFGFEVKQPGKKPSELQELEIEAIRKAGGVAHVVTSADQAVGLVRAALARSKKRR